MRVIWPAIVFAAILAARLTKAADELPLLADLPRAGDLAVTADGQSVACVDDAAGAIVMVVPGGGRSSRVAVTAPPAGSPRPIAIGFIDDTVLAAVCCAGSDWSLRTWRLRLTEPADFASPLQSVGLGRADDREPEMVHLVVSRSGRWLAVVGLDPPVVRAVIGGVRVGPPTARLSPRLGAGVRPVAATVGPDDELVLVSAEQGPGRAIGSIAFFGADGRRLLDLATGIGGIRDVACAADGSGLFVVATQGDGQRAGLWRLDAASQDGRQVIRPTLVAELPDPRALVCPSPGAFVVTQGTPDRTVVQVHTPPHP